MPFAFNKDHITMIIEEYRKYPELYDRSNELYNDNSRRYDCWLEITQKLMSTFDISPTIHDVKHKIKTLRTQLAHETEKERKMKMRNRPYRSTWCYYKLLIFLVKGGFIERKGIKSNSTLKQIKNGTSETAIESNDMGFQDDSSSLSFYDPLEVDCKPDIHLNNDSHNIVNDSPTTSSYKDSRFQFEREHIEIIIELYKNYPELYNTRDPQYYDRERKLECWEEITAKLSAACNISPSIDEIKYKVRLLRTQYAHELKRERTNNGKGPNGRTFKSNWWCYNLLSFLSQPNSTQERRMSHSDLSTTSEQNGTVEEAGSNDVVSAESPVKDILDIHDVDFSYPPSLQESSDEDSKSSILPESHDKQKSQSSTNKPQKTDSPDDDLSIFGQYIEAELRKINDKKKITKLKRNIVNLIYDTIDEDQD